MKHLSVLRCLAILSLLASCGQNEDEGPPDVAYLSTDGYFVVGDSRIILPFVAVEQVTISGSTQQPHRKRSDQKKLLELAGNPNSPLEAQSMRLYLSSYETFGEYGVSREICARLSKEWAISICHNKRPGKLTNVPVSFELVDRSLVTQIVKVTTVGGEERFDQLSKMKLQIGQPEIECDMKSKFCTAAVAISPGLLAVWAVWSSEQPPETGLAMGMRQGQAIYWFVSNLVRINGNLLFK